MRLPVVLAAARRRVAAVTFGLDPGPVISALVLYDEGRGPYQHYRADNEWILAYLKAYHAAPGDVLVIERIASMGMTVGDEVFETVFWSGRFAQAWSHRGFPYYRMKRIDVKLSLCGQARAKDGNVRQALIDRFGGAQATKKGGPLYKIAGDEWQAFAVAVAWTDAAGQTL